MSAHAVLCSLSRRERGGVRALRLSMTGNPLTPALSPSGERESDRGKSHYGSSIPPE